MKCKTILLALFGLLGWAAVNAQTLPRKVSNVEVLNLEAVSYTHLTLPTKA